MVLLDRSELTNVFAEVKAAAVENADTPTVLIIASHSIDSLAACAILQRLMEDELISHKVVPVTDYDMLQRVYTEQIADAAELRSVFLINCGGIISFVEWLCFTCDLRCRCPDSHSFWSHWYVNCHVA